MLAHQSTHSGLSDLNPAVKHRWKTIHKQQPGDHSLEKGKS